LSRIEKRLITTFVSLPGVLKTPGARMSLPLLMLEWGLRRHSLSDVSSSRFVCEALWNRTDIGGSVCMKGQIKSYFLNELAKLNLEP